MPNHMINTPDALDAAIAAAIETRREKLMRIAEGKGIRVRVAYACAVMVCLFAIAALLAGDRKAAIILASQFCVVIGFVSLATSAARRKARRELERMKTSN